MNEVQYLDLSSQKAWHIEQPHLVKGKGVDVLLTEARNSILSIRDQGQVETEKHLDKIKDLLALCASFFSEADSSGMLLIPGKDREELMAAEKLFNSFRIELSHAKDEKLQRLIEAITPELQLPLSPAVIEQVRRNAVARAEFLEQYNSYTAGDIHRMNSSNANNRAALASGWRSKGKIFAVNYKGNLYYPDFQFNTDARPRKIIADVIKIFGMENADWQLALWFVTPNVALNGNAPVAVIESNPNGLIKAAKEEVTPTLF